MPYLQDYVKSDKNWTHPTLMVLKETSKITFKFTNLRFVLFLSIKIFIYVHQTKFKHLSQTK